MSVAGNVVAVSDENAVTTEELNILANQAQAEYLQIAHILGRSDSKQLRVSVEDVDVSYTNHHRRTIVTGA